MDLSTQDSMSLVKMKKTFAMTEGSISLPSSLLAAQNMKEVLAKSCHLVCRDPEETTKQSLFKCQALLCLLGTL